METGSNRVSKYIGCIFYRYETEDAESLVKYRLLGIQNVKTSKILDMKTKEIRKIDSDYLMDNFKIVSPDGIISANIVSTNISADKSKIDMMDDVIVLMYTMKDKQEGIEDPWCVCRQNINDVFNEYMNSDPITQAGCCISREDMPTNINMKIATYCDKIEFSYIFNVYMNDSIEDILNIIPKSKFDKVLSGINDKFIKNVYIAKHGAEMANRARNEPSVYGYCRSLKQLLKENNFEYDFYTGFGIQPVPFKVTLNDNNALIESQVLVLSNLFRQNIKDTVVVPFSKSINMDKIKMHKAIIRDENGNTYIVGYIIDGQYIETDEEALEATKQMHDYAELMLFSKNL